jgi:hypothetical protein
VAISEMARLPLALPSACANGEVAGQNLRRERRSNKPDAGNGKNRIGKKMADNERQVAPSHLCQSLIFLPFIFLPFSARWQAAFRRLISSPVCDNPRNLRFSSRGPRALAGIVLVLLPTAWLLRGASEVPAVSPEVHRK